MPILSPGSMPVESSILWSNKMITGKVQSLPSGSVPGTLSDGNGQKYPFIESNTPVQVGDAVTFEAYGAKKGFKAFNVRKS